MEIEKGQVTQLLKAMARGDPDAAGKLLPLVYGELHRLAGSYMRNERPDHTLQATALINEAYLRLAREDIELSTLEGQNPRQGKVVELRYFGGLSVEQIASLLEVSPRSVKRDWSLARISLFRELQPGAASSPGHRK